MARSEEAEEMTHTPLAVTWPTTCSGRSLATFRPWRCAALPDLPPLVHAHADEEHHHVAVVRAHHVFGAGSAKPSGVQMIQGSFAAEKKDPRLHELADELQRVVPF